MYGCDTFRVTASLRDRFGHFYAPDEDAVAASIKSDYKQRIRDRYRRAEERAEAGQQLTELAAQEKHRRRPALLDAIPRHRPLQPRAPEIREALYAVLDVQVLYRQDKN